MRCILILLIIFVAINLAYAIRSIDDEINQVDDLCVPYACVTDDECYKSALPCADPGWVGSAPRCFPFQRKCCCVEIFK